MRSRQLYFRAKLSLILFGLNTPQNLKLLSRFPIHFSSPLVNKLHTKEAWQNELRTVSQFSSFSDIAGTKFYPAMMGIIIGFLSMNEIRRLQAALTPKDPSLPPYDQVYAKYNMELSQTMVEKLYFSSLVLGHMATFSIHDGRIYHSGALFKDKKNIDEIRLKPTEVPLLPGQKVIQVVSGRKRDLLALTAEGRVLRFHNSLATNCAAKFLDIDEEENPAMEIYSGGNNAIIVCRHTIYGYSHSHDGFMGLRSDIGHSDRLIKLPMLDELSIAKIALTDYEAVILTTEGLVYYLELNDDNVFEVTPVAPAILFDDVYAGDRCYLLDTNGEVYYFGGQSQLYDHCENDIIRPGDIQKFGLVAEKKVLKFAGSGYLCTAITSDYKNWIIDDTVTWDNPQTRPVFFLNLSYSAESVIDFKMHITHGHAFALTKSGIWAVAPTITEVDSSDDESDDAAPAEGRSINQYGVLGLGHDRPVNQITKVEYATLWPTATTADSDPGSAAAAEDEIDTHNLLSSTK